MHPPRHSLDISNRKRPCTWFIDFHVVQLLVQPTQDILVRQPISHPQRVCFASDGTSSTPLRSGSATRGALGKAFSPCTFCRGTGPIGEGTKRFPNTSKQGTKPAVAHKWADWLHNPCHLGCPQHFRVGTKSEVAYKWAHWLHQLCHLGGPQRLRLGDKTRSGPRVGRLAT